MDIGHLEAEIRDGKLAGYVGEISLADVAGGEIALAPRKFPRTPDSPSHDVHYRPAGASRWAPFGVAWTKKMQNGEQYLSIQLQGPRIGEVNIAAFPDAEDKHGAEAGFACLFNLVYSPRGKTRKAGPAAADAALSADGLPF